MYALALASISIAGFFLAYVFYSKFLSGKLFPVLELRNLPSHELEDGIDYVPTRRSVLFGHHFVSIAGLGPIMGPAIAVIWGWLPAFLWVFFGAIFLGAVHDFGALYISLKSDGRSIGDVARDLIGLRAGTLFMVIIFFLLALAMGVFALIIATLLSEGYYPQAVIPVFSLMVIAMVIGTLVYKKGVGIFKATVFGVAAMFVMIYVGMLFPVTGISKDAWICILLVYAYFASSLPVWLLLQPRDYLNSFQLYAGVALMYVGLLCVPALKIVAPAVNTASGKLPSLFPFLFITVACGAISGFHSLVSSGTTAKQLSNPRDARFIGYGGMLAEGLLAVIVIIACTATYASTDAWHARYSSWEAMDKLGPKLESFISGAASFISRLGVPEEFAAVFMSVIVVGFAMTTLDSATRLLRYNIQELGRTFHVKLAKNRYCASLVAVVAIGYFALMKVSVHDPVTGLVTTKETGLILWQLFGSTNQLLAALGLLAVTVYLFQRRRPTVYTLVPMLFMIVVTVTALLMKIRSFWIEGSWPLLVISSVILLMSIWLIIEAIIVSRRYALEVGRSKRIRKASGKEKQTSLFR
ncbi:MAG: carbon starvation protein A [Candidatus Tritonobacter lacicola]|nr:carbon starvation protein A [Candidatus Tritonobacter lacicola]